jgi:hypothetical protein
MFLMFPKCLYFHLFLTSLMFHLPLMFLYLYHLSLMFLPSLTPPKHPNYPKYPKYPLLAQMLR